MSHDRNARAATAGIRILVTVVGVSAMALWPAAWWRWLTVAVIGLATLTIQLRASLRPLLRRAVVVWLLAALVALGWLGRPDWLSHAANLLVKATLSLWAVHLLVYATPLPLLVEGLRWLHLPAVWTETFGFWGRYSSVLADEWRRLQLARRARTFQRSRWLRFKALAGGLGLLFIRAYERAEQVHRAMLARGYRGIDLLSWLLGFLVLTMPVGLPTLSAAESRIPVVYGTDGNGRPFPGATIAAPPRAHLGG